MFLKPLHGTQVMDSDTRIWCNRPCIAVRSEPACNRPCIAVGSESACRSRGRKFDPGPVPYFHGNYNFYGHSPPSVVSRRVVVSYKRKYVQKILVNCIVKLAKEKSVVR